MKNCGMCDTPLHLEGDIYKCRNCGNRYREEDLDPEQFFITPPIWGAITFDLSGFHSHWQAVYKEIESCWREMEHGTSQGLFEWQFDSIELPRPVFTLYGTKSTYLDIEDFMKERHAPPGALQFSEITHDEMMHIRDQSSSRYAKRNRG